MSSSCHSALPSSLLIAAPAKPETRVLTGFATSPPHRCKCRHLGLPHWDSDREAEEDSTAVVEMWVH